MISIFFFFNINLKNNFWKNTFWIAIAAKQVFQTAKPPTDRYIDSRTLFQEFRRKHKDDSKSLSNVVSPTIYLSIGVCCICHVDVVGMCFVRNVVKNIARYIIYLKGAKTTWCFLLFGMMYLVFVSLIHKHIFSYMAWAFDITNIYLQLKLIEKNIQQKTVWRMVNAQL